jgi:hypothetical protein
MIADSHREAGLVGADLDLQRPRSVIRMHHHVRACLGDNGLQIGDRGGIHAQRLREPADRMTHDGYVFRGGR